MIFIEAFGGALVGSVLGLGVAAKVFARALKAKMTAGMADLFGGQDLFGGSE